MKHILFIFIIFYSFIFSIEDKDYYKNGKVLGERLYQLNTKDKYIVLTIDDGPSHYTGQILSILEKNKIKATFFLVGSEIESYPHMVRNIKDSGHEIASHSYTHRDFKTMTNEEIFNEEIVPFNDLLLKHGGGKTKLIRFPYGSGTPEQVSFLREKGYYIINWSLDTFDWKKNWDLSLDQINKKAKNGSIILMHSNKMAPYLLPDLIRELKSQGYIFVTIEEFLKNENLEEFTIEDNRTTSEKRREFLRGSIKSEI